MKINKLILCLGTVALAVASAASSYSVTVINPTMVGTSELKPGVYKLQVEGDKAVFTKGKSVVEAAVTVENNDKKFSDTALSIQDSKLKEIHVGGTTMKVMFKPGVVAGGGN